MSSEQDMTTVVINSQQLWLAVKKLQNQDNQNPSKDGVHDLHVQPHIEELFFGRWLLEEREHSWVTNKSTAVFPMIHLIATHPFTYR